MKAIYIFGWTLLFPFGGRAQGMHLTPGVYWVAKGSPNLILNNGSLTNNGNFIADSGTVIITSDTSATGAFIDGSNPVSFYNLRIGKNLQLNNNAFITGRITLDSGNLELNGYTLDLGSTGSIQGERNGARIKGGNIRVTALLNGPNAVNPGNIGVEITSQANLGSTVIVRGHTSLTETGIQRWFDIAPEVNAKGIVSLRFLYLDGELAGNDKNSLTLFSGNEMDNTWTSWGKDAADPTANWISKSNIDSLHRFTLAVGRPLEITPSLKIYPNPARDEFTLQLVSGQDGKGVLYLYDQGGKVLEAKTACWHAGVNTIQWNIGRYATGIYYLSTGRSNGSTLKILKE